MLGEKKIAKIKLTIWNEFIHEKKNPVKKIYPEGMHEAIAQYMRKFPDIEVKTATLDQKDHGLTEEVLNNTDVLIWWGHVAHDKVKDKIVDRIQKRILDGMGLIVLHSGHYSKIFKRMMGTGCGLNWREDGEKEHLWVVNPYHPITKGLDAVIELEHTEMYGEVFDIPNPDDVIFISWFEGGEVFRSGVTFHRGRGKIFYFRPGHESFPIFHNEDILQVLQNAVRWAKYDGNDEAQGINSCNHTPFTLAPVKKYDFEGVDHPEEFLK